MADANGEHAREHELPATAAQERRWEGGGDLHGADDEVFDRVLDETLAAMEAVDVQYALIGGIACTGLGRPRWTHDIDLFVRHEDADRALQALAERGFETKKADASWYYKAFKSRVMVDLIFRSTGGFFLDEEMAERTVEGTFRGRRVRYLPPEDLLILKAVVHDEAQPRHWYDALGILAESRLDWSYLLRRARRAPRRVLSLLLYAESVDLLVPARVIRRLYRRVYES